MKKRDYFKIHIFKPHHTERKGFFVVEGTNFFFNTKTFPLISFLFHSSLFPFYLISPVFLNE